MDISTFRRLERLFTLADHLFVLVDQIKAHFDKVRAQVNRLAHWLIALGGCVIAKEPAPVLLQRLHSSDFNLNEYRATGNRAPSKEPVDAGRRGGRGNLLS